MISIESKKDIAEKLFGMTYHALYMWTVKGVPKGKIERTDLILRDREERNGAETDQSVFTRHIALRTREGFVSRLKTAFPGFSW